MNNPRIIAGEFKNFRLQIPQGIRPITDRVKKTLFDILDSNYQYTSVLDGFCGSGNLGIEALSRGAKFAMFVDSAEESIHLTKINLHKLKLDEERYSVVTSSFDKFIVQNSAKFDLILLDPPFNYANEIRIRKIIEHLAIGGVIVLKMPRDVENIRQVLAGGNVIREEQIGENILYFLEKPE